VREYMKNHPLKKERRSIKLTEKCSVITGHALTIARIKVLNAISKGSKTLYTIHIDEQLSFGTVAPALSLFRRCGLVDATRRKSRNRMIVEYSLTPQGKKELRKIKKLLRD
jgi:DNA-binding MarR family transcriptional regulator